MFGLWVIISKGRSKQAAAVGLLLALAVSGMSERALAQDLSAILKDPHTAAINNVLDAWDSADLVIMKKNIEDGFSQAVKRRMAKPVYDFEMSPTYASFMVAVFSKLPEVLKVERKLSLGARAVLLGAAYDNRGGLKAMLKTPEQFAQRFQMELYVTLGSSQQWAEIFNSPEIEARSVLAAFEDFRSLLYPFCCWKEYR